MATHYDDTHHLIISGDDARGGVTGHNVRYVLALGMTGVIAAFAAIAIYFGYDALHARVMAALSESPSDFLRALAPYVALILCATIGAGLLLGIWNLVSGSSDSDGQSLMRLRVVTQFVLVCAILAIFAYTAG